MANQSTTTPAVGAGGYALGVKRTPDEWDALALSTIVPALQGGATMNQMRAKYGTGRNIRAALTRVGYDTKGQQVKAVKTTAASPKVLAKRVADRRGAGASWWRLELETGKAARELKDLLRQHGHEAVATGRVKKDRS